MPPGKWRVVPTGGSPCGQAQSSKGGKPSYPGSSRTPAPCPVGLGERWPRRGIAGHPSPSRLTPGAESSKWAALPGPRQGRRSAAGPQVPEVDHPPIVHEFWACFSQRAHCCSGRAAQWACARPPSGCRWDSGSGRACRLCLWIPNPCDRKNLGGDGRRVSVENPKKQSSRCSMNQPFLEMRRFSESDRRPGRCRWAAPLRPSLPGEHRRTPTSVKGPWRPVHGGPTPSIPGCHPFSLHRCETRRYSRAGTCLKAQSTGQSRAAYCHHHSPSTPRCHLP